MENLPMNDYERQQIDEHVAHIKYVNQLVSDSVSLAASDLNDIANRISSLSIILRHASNRLIDRDVV